jgi:hypothetical protein
MFQRRKIHHRVTRSFTEEKEKDIKIFCHIDSVLLCALRGYNSLGLNRATAFYKDKNLPRSFTEEDEKEILNSMLLRGYYSLVLNSVLLRVLCGFSSLVFRGYYSLRGYNRRLP